MMLRTPIERLTAVANAERASEGVQVEVNTGSGNKPLPEHRGSSHSFYS